MIARLLVAVVTAALMLVAGRVDASGLDITAPELDRAEVDGTTLVLTYDEALDWGSVPAVGVSLITVDDGAYPAVSGSVTAKGAYAVTVDSGAGPAVRSVVIGGSEVRLTLASAVAYGAEVTVSYSVPSLNPVQDVAGNDAVALNDHAVTNNTRNSTLTAGLTLASATAVALAVTSLDLGKGGGRAANIQFLNHPRGTSASTSWTPRRSPGRGVSLRPRPTTVR